VEYGAILSLADAAISDCGASSDEQRSFGGGISAERNDPPASPPTAPLLFISGRAPEN
jgi:hypothetical protein